ncbi:transient receptor potential cation channel subfamily A member 1-like [Ptychodera flava]|uniref:transient receptor potential cation channel subfamily A member 1-like n=1 Tax=Ptychodera flava TaxID=63121 RepID=UPI00396A7E00
MSEIETVESIGDDENPTQRPSLGPVSDTPTSTLEVEAVVIENPLNEQPSKKGRRDLHEGESRKGISRKKTEVAAVQSVEMEGVVIDNPRHKPGLKRPRKQRREVVGQKRDSKVVAEFDGKNVNFVKSKVENTETNWSRHLHDLVNDRDVEQLEQALRCKPKFEHDISSDVDDEGRTLLQRAVRSGSVKAVEILIRYGADAAKPLVNTNENLLHEAVRSGNVKIMHLILKCSDVDVNLKGVDDRSPLHLAITMTTNMDIIEEMVEHGANVNAKDINGRTPVILATEHCPPAYLRDFLDRFPDVNVNETDDFGYSPILIAASQGNGRKLEILLKFDADMTERDHEGRTVIHKVVGNRDALNILLKREESASLIDVTDSHGLTALHQAAQKHPQSVSLLLMKKFNPNARNKREETPLHIAARNGYMTAVKQLADYDKTGEIVNASDHKQRTPLHIASYYNHVDVITFLFERNAVVTSDADGCYPVHVAARNGSFDALRALLKKNPMWIDVRDEKIKNTPLHHAAHSGQSKVVKMFLILDASIKENKDHKNCLDVAIDRGHEGIAMEIASSAQWDKCLRKKTNPQLATLISKWPNVARKFLNRMKKAEKAADEVKLVVYDFGYLKIPPSLRERQTPLQAIYKQKQCLKHDVIAKYLLSCWYKFGAKLFFTGLFFNIVYVIMTCVVVWLEFLNNPLPTNMTSQQIETNESISILEKVFGVILMMIAGIDITAIVYALVMQRLDAIDLRLFLETLQDVTTVLFVVSLYVKAVMSAFLVSMGIVAILAAWLVLLLQIQRLPIFGIYAIMGKRYVRTLLKTSPLLLFPVIGLGFAFYILLSSEDAFESVPRSVLTVGVMMFREVYYEGNFLHGSDTVVYTMIVVVFIVFILLTIVISNIVIALAVNDVLRTQHDQQQQLTLLQIRLQFQLERSLLYKVIQPISRAFTRQSRGIGHDESSLYPESELENKSVSWFQWCFKGSSPSAESERETELREEIFSLKQEMISQKFHLSEMLAILRRQSANQPSTPKFSFAEWPQSKNTSSA